MNYSVQYAFAWINGVIGVVASALAAAYLTIHPSWLDSDLAATAGIVAGITVALGGILPPLQRTPGTRDTKYLAAAQGALPRDVVARYPLICPAEPVTDRPVGPPVASPASPTRPTQEDP